MLVRFPVAVSVDAMFIYAVMQIILGKLHFKFCSACLMQEIGRVSHFHFVNFCITPPAAFSMEYRYGLHALLFWILSHLLWNKTNIYKYFLRSLHWHRRVHMTAPCSSKVSLNDIDKMSSYWTTTKPSMTETNLHYPYYILQFCWFYCYIFTAQTYTFNCTPCYREQGHWSN